MPDNIDSFFRLKPGSVWRDRLDALAETDLPQMVTLGPGRFLMGAPADDTGAEDDEKPQHVVTLRYTMAIGKYPVTFDEWDAARAAGAEIPYQDDRGAGRGRHPVMLVTLQESWDYIDWLNRQLGLTGRQDAYRLPSEAEWEYACRAGSITHYSTGDRISPSDANFDSSGRMDATKQSNRRQWATDVDAFPANALGLHDMLGNVWERCADRWHDSYAEDGRPDDGSAWMNGESTLGVIRGGSWLSSAWELRSSHRGMIMPDYRNIIIGFRLARTLG